MPSKEVVALLAAHSFSIEFLTPSGREIWIICVIQDLIATTGVQQEREHAELVGFKGLTQQRLGIGGKHLVAGSRGVLQEQLQRLHIALLDGAVDSRGSALRKTTIGFEAKTAQEWDQIVLAVSHRDMQALFLPKAVPLPHNLQSLAAAQSPPMRYWRKRNSLPKR